MKVEEFDYHLPEELIAQTPAANRDESRLMVLHRETGEIEERIFKDIINYFEPGDLLVLNNSRVIPARLFGKKAGSGTVIEVLLLTELTEGRWEVLVRPGRRVKKGVEIEFGGGRMTGRTLDYTDFGGRIMEFSYQGDFEQILDELGELPLPPYIHRELEEPERYQTVYARERGSVAAPTAGLHFTPELLDEIREAGVGTAYLTLHVGLGTFRPVKAETVEEHRMHAEYYELTPETAARINSCRSRGDRVIAVGTTVTRTLESTAGEDGLVAPEKGWTEIFIYPGYRFKAVDVLLTNFHLPRSTLMMLISAFAGKEKVFEAYQRAVERRYRFFSLGDAMLII